MSVNLLTIESIYDLKKNLTNSEFSKETKSRNLHLLDENSFLENDELHV